MYSPVYSVRFAGLQTQRLAFVGLALVDRPAPCSNAGWINSIGTHMIFEITRMRHLGKPIDPKHLRGTDRIIADVAISHESCVMGRAAVVAKLRGEFPLSPSPMPELIDVQIHSMAPNGMTLTGVEVIDGVTYGQSWRCRQP